MSLNHFSGKYEDSLNPYYDNVDATKIFDENNNECFTGIEANTSSTNDILILFNGRPYFLTSEIYYATYDGKYVELYINQPFIESFTNPQSIFQFTLIEPIKENIRPTGINGVELYTIYGGCGGDFGYSAYSFEFNGENLVITFHQNNEVNAIDLNVDKDLSLNLKLVYKLNN
jgi:hypothetical protein